MERSSGILLHISSLPSPYGIGTLGKAAYDFADFLHAAGQKYWQLLPLGPTGYGNSPYQSTSTFAGNPFFIDLDLLAEDGLLTAAELKSLEWGKEPRCVDYGKVYATRQKALRLAFARGYERDRAAVEEFGKKNPWLANYALYMALSGHFGKGWMDWPDEAIRRRTPEAVAEYTRKLADEIAFYSYVQFLFFRQWNKLRDYLHKLGIKVIGDLPIYVPLDSADVWAEPQFFQLDDKFVPKAVAGVPPDYFSEDGQLWGNPLYDYDAMKADGFGWWIRRVEGAGKLFDVIRIDHFRGLESYWSVPYGAPNARKGTWKKGPGMDLVGVLTSWFHDLEFIAEDLGVQTKGLAELLTASGLPGMKVLQFAFEPSEPSDYLPHNHIKNCVCYAGTHDNNTVAGWLAEAGKEELAAARLYLGLNKEEGPVWGFLRAGMTSVANLFVAQMQDYLELDASCRMNTPGTVKDNWTWRLKKGELTKKLAERIAKLTKAAGR